MYACIHNVSMYVGKCICMYMYNMPNVLPNTHSLSMPSRYIFWGVYTEEIREYAHQVGVPNPTLAQINSEQEKALRLEFDSIDRDHNG